MSTKENYGDAAHVRRKRTWVKFPSLLETSFVLGKSPNLFPFLYLKNGHTGFL